jgi:hypothetical protein
MMPEVFSAGEDRLSWDVTRMVTSPRASMPRALTAH